jgi:hypothetical protein
VFAEYPDGLSAGMSDLARRSVLRTYVNCWHMGKHESFAMWRLYAAAGQGVAVRSTFRALTQALRGSEEIHVGTVNYLDPRRTPVPEGNTMNPFMHKRISFDYERELRALIQRWPAIDDDAQLDLAAPRGIPVAVDLQKLVKFIYVGPGQPAWFQETVEVVVQHISPGLSVRRSTLDVEPVF